MAFTISFHMEFESEGLYSCHSMFCWVRFHNRGFTVEHLYKSITMKFSSVKEKLQSAITSLGDW